MDKTLKYEKKNFLLFFIVFLLSFSSYFFSYRVASAGYYEDIISNDLIMHFKNYDTSIMLNSHLAGVSWGNFYTNVGFSVNLSELRIIKDIALPICSNNGGTVQLTLYNQPNGYEAIYNNYSYTFLNNFYIDKSVSTTILPQCDNIVFNLDRSNWTHFNFPQGVSITRATGLLSSPDNAFSQVGATLIQGLNWSASEGNNHTFNNNLIAYNKGISIWKEPSGNTGMTEGGNCPDGLPISTGLGAGCDGSLTYYPDFSLQTTEYTAPPIGTTTPPIIDLNIDVEYLDCGITSGDLILNCIKNAFIWTVKTSSSTFTPMQDLMTQLKKKPPMGYLSSIFYAFDFSTTTEQEITLVSTSSPFMTFIFTPVRSMLVVILYMFGAVWFFRRVKDIQI